MPSLQQLADSGTDLEADYVVVGGGTAGLAFADALASASDATIVLIDRRPAPGGHWVEGYPFLRLHHSSYYYGVDSLPLGAGGRMPAGRDRGQEERASGAEGCAYFQRVLDEKLLATGRVAWLPRSEWSADGTVRSLDGGATRRVHARRKVVDATYTNSRVPATDPPPFPVEEGVRIVTPADLVQARSPDAEYVLVGGGKTSMDVAAWLLETGTDPEAIAWIRPREAWLLNRDHLQAEPDSFALTFGGFAAEMEAARDATSPADLYRRLEAASQLLRIDPAVEPTMYRCSTVSRAELADLRRVRRVVRLGRVRRLERTRAVLERGELPVSPRHVFVHCCADGIPPQPPQPVFQGRRMLLQLVRRCSPSLSAAMLARIETGFATDEEKNFLSRPVPVPAVPADWMRMQLEESQNSARWSRVPALREWLSKTRLNPLAAQSAAAGKEPANAAILARFRAAAAPAMENMARLLQAAAPGA